MEKQEIFNKLDRIAVLTERVKAFNLLQEDYINISDLENNITLNLYGGGGAKENDFTSPY